MSTSGTQKSGIETKIAMKKYQLCLPIAVYLANLLTTIIFHVATLCGGGEMTGSRFPQENHFTSAFPDETASPCYFRSI